MLLKNKQHILKRITAVLAAAIMTVLIMPAAAVRAAYGFSDISSSASYYDAITWSVDNGIIQGYSDGTFRPKNTCTRQQFVVMLWRLCGKPAAKSKVHFSDVNSSMSSYRAIQWAIGEGIIVGYNDGTFRPSATVTRAQVMVMLWRLSGKPSASMPTSFPDVAKNMSSYKAIQWGYQAEIIKGYSNGNFGPSDNCTRSQVVTMLYRYAGPKPTQGDPMTTMAQDYWSDTNYLIMVDIDWHYVGLYKGAPGMWTNVFMCDCSNGAWDTQTPTGQYSIYQKLYYFDVDNVRCFYACRFYGSYLLHSILYEQTPTPQYVLDGRLGMNVSHGCVRMPLDYIKYIYDTVPYGTKVVIYR